MEAFSPRYDAALVFAARAHRNQIRKGTDIPYLVHVVHVSVMLLRSGFREECVIAGVLHDVIEDCGVAPAAITDAFGDEVAHLVQSVSKPPGLSWEESRAAMLSTLITAGPEVAALKTADTLHNAQCVLHDWHAVGPELFDRFKRGPVAILAYYRGVQAGARRWPAAQPLANELAAVLDELEKTIPC